MTKSKRAERARLDATSRLYEAVAAYLDAHGGKGLLASGVQIIQWPTDRPAEFTVGVKILGRKPKYAAARGRKRAKAQAAKGRA